MNAAVFLDRDNTLIHNDGDLGDPDKVRLIKGAASAVASLQGLGYKVVVVTNQGGVARGKYTEEDVDAVHRRVNELIQANSGAFIDRFYYCPYHPEGSERRYRRDHPWRKPKPGMLIQAGKHMALTMDRSWMVGDQLRDIQAGYAAGVTPILIDPTGELATAIDSMPPSSNGNDVDADVDPVIIEPNRDYFVARNLIEAARIIGQKRRPPSSVKAAPERRPSRVVVEEERTPQAESAEPKKVVKKKIVRRRKKVATDAADITTLEPAADAANKTTTNTTHETAGETANENERVSSVRGEAPGKSPTPHSVSTGQSDVDIDLDATFDDDAVHAPTLTMPSLSPNVDLDDDDDDSSVDVSAPSNGRAERPAQNATDRLAAHPAIKTPPTKTQPTAAPAPSRDEQQTRSTPRSRDESERPTTKQPEPASKHAPSTSATESDSQNSASSAGDDSPSPWDNTNVDQTLRQILQELRNQRLTGSEFSYIGVMAIVLQVVAIVCLLAALLMGSGNDQIFSRWIACAVVLQLGTIAMLLFKK